MQMDEMDDICRNNRVNRSEVIVDVTYRGSLLLVFAREREVHAPHM